MTSIGIRLVNVVDKVWQIIIVALKFVCWLWYTSQSQIFQLKSTIKYFLNSDVTKLFSICFLLSKSKMDSLQIFIVTWFVRYPISKVSQYWLKQWCPELIKCSYQWNVLLSFLCKFFISLRQSELFTHYSNEWLNNSFHFICFLDWVFYQYNA